MKSEYITPKFDIIKLVSNRNTLVNFSANLDVENITWNEKNGDDYWLIDL